MRERGESGVQKKRTKGWIEAEYDRHMRTRRKKSGNCLLEVKGEDGETTHLLFRACDFFVELSATCDERVNDWCENFSSNPCSSCWAMLRPMLHPGTLLLLLKIAASVSLIPSLLVTVVVFPMWIGLMWWRIVYFGNDRDALLRIGLTGMCLDVLVWMYTTYYSGRVVLVLFLAGPLVLIYLVFRIRARSLVRQQAPLPTVAGSPQKPAGARGNDKEICIGDEAQAKGETDSTSLLLKRHPGDRSKVCVWCGVERSRFVCVCMSGRARAHKITHIRALRQCRIAPEHALATIRL